MKTVIADEVVQRFVYLMEMTRDAQFAIGDELIEQVKLHGGKKSEVINYLAGHLQVSASTLYDYMRVSERWSPAMREVYQTLDWTIYRNADPANPEDIELLNKAVDEGWNATKFKEEKFPAMKDIRTIIERVKSIISRNLHQFKPSTQAELDYILARLERILEQEEGKKEEAEFVGTR